jgi:hypothetical protein
MLDIVRRRKHIATVKRIKEFTAISFKERSSVRQRKRGLRPGEREWQRRASFHAESE